MRRAFRAMVAIACAGACLAGSPAIAAERPAARPPEAARRDLPPGASEAQVRRYCTRKFEEEASYIPELAGGASGMLANRLIAEFQRCLRRNGVRP